MNCGATRRSGNSVTGRYMAELPNKQLIRKLLSTTRKLTQFSGMRRQSNTFELAGARGCPQDRGRQTAFPESRPTRALPCGELTTSELSGQITRYSERAAPGCLYTLWARRSYRYLSLN